MTLWRRGNWHLEKNKKSTDTLDSTFWKNAYTPHNPTNFGNTATSGSNLSYLCDTSRSDNAIGNLQSHDAENLANETILQPPGLILVIPCSCEDCDNTFGPNFQGLSELDAYVFCTRRGPAPVPDGHVVVMRLDVVEAAQLIYEVGQAYRDVGDRVFGKETIIEGFTKRRCSGRGAAGGGVDWEMDPFTKED